MEIETSYSFGLLLPPKSKMKQNLENNKPTQKSIFPNIKH